MKRVLTTLLKSVCIIALVLCGMDAQAQGNLVTGAVRDAKGEPVIGATVIVKGTATGATSGADGRYSIQAGPDATLEFSFIGYKKQEVPVGTRSAIDVVLEEDALMVDDVVVIGYGTQSRRTITAAVSKVDGEKLAGAPVNSIGDALKGRVGGVRVSSADNQPGSDPVFLIRGGSSINQSNAPIIIIDGVNREMTGLNPNDIESIEVLKDAASAGIYGARASNGVILITTKKGSMARGPQVTFEAQAAWTSPAVRFDLMDGGDYLRTMRTMLNEYPSTYAYGSGILTGANSAGIGNGDNSVWTPKFVDTPADVPAGWKVMVDPIDHSKLIAYQDNDQQKQWFDDSYWMNYYVGVNGGNDKVQYAASAGYTKDGGIGINTDFSRFTFHGNTSFKILRNLKATTVFDYSETKGNTLPSSGIATYWTTVGRGMFMPATHRDYHVCVDDKTNDFFSDPLAYATAAAGPQAGATAPGSAKAGDILLAEDFSKVIHGGDIANFAAGYYPPSSNRGTYAAASGDNPSGFSATRCTANEFDLFSGGGVAAPYTEGTGLSAWGKSGNIAGRPGYVKMGAGSAAASLYTPELTALPDAATVKVRFSAQAYSEKYDGSGADAGKILVKAVRGAVLGAKGAITGTVTEVSAADPVDISAAKARFREFEATLTNVTPDCRIVISTSEKRALLDNVVVTCTAITPATKPAAPGGVSFDAAAAADRLTLKWNAVPDATSYTVAYWKGSASAPESEYAYKTGIASTATSQELTNLESNTSYWAKVKAVGSLDSDWSETANATTMDSGGEPLLPTADLLDVVFRNDGSAMDNSSSATPVRRMPSSRP